MIFVLLPAYDEEYALEPLVNKIDSVMRQMGTIYRVIVVNDGSTDGTEAIAEELSQRFPVHVIRHKYNRGLGETARDGFEYIAEIASSQDMIVRMDCDDTHDPKFIPAMIEKLNQGYELVIASRYARGGGQIGVDWYRRTVSRTANLLMKILFPISGVWEYSCGFRAYRAALIHDALAIFGNRFIDLKGMGFTCTLEKLIKFQMMGVKAAEIPFVLRYDQKRSSSKLITSITTVGYLALIAKYFIAWGNLGKQWKQEIQERKRRLYTTDGSLIEPLRRTS